jgi:hypothetical protein
LRTSRESHTLWGVVRHIGVLLIALAAALACASESWESPNLDVVLTNEKFQTLAVDPSGTAFGISRDSADPTQRYRLYTSSDEGATWVPVHDFPAFARITSAFAVLSDGTLLAGVTTGAFDLFRSVDHGVTWAKVFTFPDSYQILTSHSITDDGEHAFMASYNVLDPGNHLNWVWRSDDMGVTWTPVRETTNHRHAHFAQVDPYTGDLYVGYGDTQAGQAEIERSRDAGTTWESVCTGTRCLSVDIAFDPDGFAVFGQDHVWEPGWIVRLDLESGETTKLAPLPGPSYSALRLNGRRSVLRRRAEASVPRHLLDDEGDGAVPLSQRGLPHLLLGIRNARRPLREPGAGARDARPEPGRLPRRVLRARRRGARLRPRYVSRALERSAEADDLRRRESSSRGDFAG